MKNITAIALTALLVLQAGCMSSPVAAPAAAMTFSDWSMLGLGTAAGAALGNSMDGNIGAPIGAAVAVAGTAAYLEHQGKQQAQLVAEAKEEARREERAILMRDYWSEATGADYVDGAWKGNERDVRYDAGVYDGLHYENRVLPRQLYFQESPR